MFAGKNILLGVSGGIAAYKAAALVSGLKKRGANVEVILTENAQRFVAPLTFETLTGNAAITDTFRHPERYDVAHISLSKQTDICVIAPATADIIGKIAHGIADDMLSTTYLALQCPVYIAPAMNTSMYRHVAVQENIRILRVRGCRIIQPGEGFLACGDTGEGRMAEPERIIEELESFSYSKQDYAGLRLLVTAGPTVEPIDPVRSLTNRSSGKMGYAVAAAALQRGATVTLITGLVHISPPLGAELIRVQTAAQMYEAVMENKAGADIIVKCAAVADWTPAQTMDSKIKKGGELTLRLVRTPDILKELGQNKNCFLVGFAAETDHLEEYAKKKLLEKNLDMIVANNVSDASIGFESDFNAVVIYEKNGGKTSLAAAPKIEIAHRLLDEMRRAYGKG